MTLAVAQLLGALAHQAQEGAPRPRHVHRALGGYEFWPSSLQTKRYIDGQLETDIRAKPQRRGP